MQPNAGELSLQKPCSELSCNAFIVGVVVRRKRNRYYPPGHLPVALVGSIT
jgi:hypothetical protein